MPPEPKPCEGLFGEVGYLITGHESASPQEDTRPASSWPRAAAEALTGYCEPKLMVYSGLYSVDLFDYLNLRDAPGQAKL